MYVLYATHLEDTVKLSIAATQGTKVAVIEVITMENRRELFSVTLYRGGR